MRSSEDKLEWVLRWRWDHPPFLGVSWGEVGYLPEWPVRIIRLPIDEGRVLLGTSSLVLLACPPPDLLTGLSARGVVWVGGWAVAAEHRVVCVWVGGCVCITWQILYSGAEVVRCQVGYGRWTGGVVILLGRDVAGALDTTAFDFGASGSLDGVEDDGE